MNAACSRHFPPTCISGYFRVGTETQNLCNTMRLSYNGYYGGFPSLGSGSDSRQALNAAIAQSVEHCPRKAGVEGSNPSCGLNSLPTVSPVFRDEGCRQADRSRQGLRSGEPGDGSVTEWPKVRDSKSREVKASWSSNLHASETWFRVVIFPDQT